MGKYEAKFIAETHSPKKGKRKKNRIVRILTVCLLLACVLGVTLFFALRKDALHGRWLYGTTVYTFDGRGEGSMELPDESFPFTYELSGDSLSLDFENPRLSDSFYDVVIRENCLILSGRDDLAGTAYELTKEND